MKEIEFITNDYPRYIAVYDSSFNILDPIIPTFNEGYNTFRRWLESEDFIYYRPHSIGSSIWFLINLTPKEATLGTKYNRDKVLCNHAVTIEEFKIIYGIYKKYEGKEMFTFHNKRFDPFSDE